MDNTQNLLEEHQINNIKQSILLRSSIALGLVGIIIMLIVLIPLYQELEQRNTQEVHFITDAKQSLIQQVLLNFTNTAQQFASRSKIRQALMDYNAQKMTQEELQEFSHNKLLDAMKSSSAAYGITRLDNQGKVAVIVGEAVTAAFLQEFDPSFDQIKLFDPTIIKDRFSLTVSSPIFDRKGNRVGTDIVLFDLEELNEITHDYNGLGETGEIILLYPQAEHYTSFFSTRNPHDNAIYTQIAEAFLASNTKNYLFPDCKECVLTARTIADTNWMLLFYIEKSELNAIINKNVIRLLWITLVVLVAGIIGIYLIISPLLSSLLKEFKQRKQVQDHLEELVATRTKDLTKAYKNLKESQAQLIQSEKMASLGQMIAGVAHEMNTPLGYVRSTVETSESIIQDLLKLVEEYQKLLNLIDQNAEETLLEQQLKQIEILTKDIHSDELNQDFINIFKNLFRGLDQINHLVSGLKNFSRKEEAKIEKIHIKDCVDNALLITNNMLKNIEIQTSLPTDIKAFKGSSSQINQVLINLLQNAYQAIEDKSQGKVWIFAEQQENKLLLKIRDNGKGIPKTILPKIFDPFFTTKDVGEGMGLGLSISYKIIKEHKGKIIVRSTEGRGTEFQIVLPTV